VERGRGRGRGVKKREELVIIVVVVVVVVVFDDDDDDDVGVVGARYTPARMPPLSPRATSLHNTPSPPASPPCPCNSRDHTLSRIVSQPKICGSDASRFPTKPFTIYHGVRL